MSVEFTCNGCGEKDNVGEVVNDKGSPDGWAKLLVQLQRPPVTLAPLLMDLCPACVSAYAADPANVHINAAQAIRRAINEIKERPDAVIDEE